MDITAAKQRSREPRHPDDNPVAAPNAQPPRAATSGTIGPPRWRASGHVVGEAGPNFWLSRRRVPVETKRSSRARDKVALGPGEGGREAGV